ncbi:MAG: nucleoside monophosphate kinase [Deltaproteobacteria bacterium]|nr:nucleoside monophosphate kinase [Deltaproteobacteria bacterium]
MKIFLMGPPGSGKSTQAVLLAERLKIPRITASALLAAAAQNDSPDGHMIKESMAKGALVPDEIVNKLLISRLKEPDCTTGFVLDGFPRTVPQATALTCSGIRIDAIVELLAEEAELLRRLTGRRIHEPSGRTYHLLFNPPKNDERDDVTGEPLIQREDDREDVVRRRLALYESHAESLRRYYAEMSDDRPQHFRVDRTGKPTKISETVIRALSAHLVESGAVRTA